ncbi:hypothetical protein ACFOD4_18535 [Pseudoroseomonas globiformis]|uniref:DUF4177 domain-containing protein n=1 Tax=Teichococcus globiformis TaxID=2307229 RepID=A0ABV7G2Y6_9PROT
MRHAALALLLLAASGPAALAQSPPPGQVTHFQEIEQSLEALLNEGWEVTGMAGNLGGIAYVLRKENKWITCQVITRREDSRSRCMTMN